MQTWPAFLNLKPVKISKVFSMLASSAMIAGEWPPNYRVHLFNVSADFFAKSFPTGTDPVKLTFLTSSLLNR